MSLRLLLRQHPQRSLALVTDTHALVFRYTQPAASPDSLNGGIGSKAQAPKCMVEFTALETLDLADYRAVHSSGVYGTLGLISIANDTFLCVISGAIRVATVRPNENVQRITSVNFCQYTLSLPHVQALLTYQDCLNREDFDHEFHGEIGSYSSDLGYSDRTENEYNSGIDSRDAGFEHPCLELKRILDGYVLSIGILYGHTLQDFLR